MSIDRQDDKKVGNSNNESNSDSDDSEDYNWFNRTKKRVIWGGAAESYEE